MPNGSVIMRGERINASAQAIGDWRLEECFLYVTLEPWPMCVGAVDTLYKLLSDPRLNHRAYAVSGILRRECGEILTQFFQDKRRLGKK